MPNFYYIGIEKWPEMNCCCCRKNDGGRNGPFLWCWDTVGWVTV